MTDGGMQEYRLTPHERVVVTERTPEALTATAEYGAGGSPPPAHYHPAQDERFEVLEGRLSVRLGGEEEKTLRPGDVLEVPRGTRHAMWNSGDTTAKVRWRTSPPGRTEEWWRLLDGLVAAGRKPGPLTMAKPLFEYRDVFRLARL